MRLNDLPFPVYGDTGFRGKCPTEALEQITFFRRLRDAYPDSQGMTPGASDIIIPGRVTFVCEMKRRDRTQSAWQDGQIEYLTAAHNAGAFACVALGCDAAWEAFQEWLTQSL